MLLAHWHYYHCRPYPDPQQPGSQAKSSLSGLPTTQYELVMQTLTSVQVQRHLAIFNRYKNENGACKKTPNNPTKVRENFLPPLTLCSAK